MIRKAKITIMCQWSALGLFALVVSFGATSKALAGCAPFPKIALWSELTHEFAHQLVDQKYDGDWDAYLAYLERYAGKLKGIHSKGKSARITWRDKKVLLKDAKLLRFLKLVNQRISITRCLADTQSIANFSTAAGGTYQGDSPDKPQSKQCARIPQVAWWKFNSHEGVIGFVSKSFGNNWKGYIGKWNERLDKLKNIKARGKHAITSTGIRLAGSELDVYINQTQKRISVVKCLAERHTASDS